MFVGKPFCVKELVESLRAENKSQVKAGTFDMYAEQLLLLCYCILKIVRFLMSTKLLTFKNFTLD